MKKFARWAAVAGGLFGAATVAYAVRTKRTHGTFLKVPFDFRLPTFARIKESWWNPEDRRILTPRVFGIGWALNIPQAIGRIKAHRAERRASSPLAEKVDTPQDSPE